MSLLVNLKRHTNGLILKFLNSYGYELNRIKPKPKPLSAITELLKSRHGKVSFVQIGANDGVIDDPIFGLISDDWSGVFVEPNPVAFKKLQELYKDRPKFKFFNVAITLEGGEVEMNIPFDSTNLGSLNNEWDHLSHIGTPNVSKIKVPSLKLQELFQRIDAAEVNLLIVDTEGYDFKLVNELLDGTKVRPDVVQYEHVLMSEEQKSSLTRKFIGCGYATVVNDVDSIAVRVSPGFTRNP